MSGMEIAKRMMNNFENGWFVRQDFFKHAYINTEDATSHALKCDTFLAHSSSDIKLVNNIIVHFKSLGACQANC
jgi:hypothetical protein